jgi:phage regulator Rha-like protein
MKTKNLINQFSSLLTYTNKDGLIVTDSLIVQREFDITEHSKVVKTIKDLITLETTRINNTRVVASCSKALNCGICEDLFIESSYKKEVGQGAIRTLKKYEITENGFMLLMMNIKGGRKNTAQKLHNIRINFIQEFNRVRQALVAVNEENIRMRKALTTVAINFLPADERGHKSRYNGVAKTYIRKSCPTMLKNSNPFTKEIQEDVDYVYDMVADNDKIALSQDVLRFEKNKEETLTPMRPKPSKQYKRYLNDGLYDNEAYQPFVNTGDGISTQIDADGNVTYIFDDYDKAYEG